VCWRGVYSAVASILKADERDKSDSTNAWKAVVESFKVNRCPAITLATETPSEIFAALEKYSPFWKKRTPARRGKLFLRIAPGTSQEE
jgi:hypothetical protein